jgi:hypothetical protein
MKHSEFFLLCNIPVTTSLRFFSRLHETIGKS